MEKSPAPTALHAGFKIWITTVLVGTILYSIAMVMYGSQSFDLKGIVVVFICLVFLVMVYGIPFGLILLGFLHFIHQFNLSKIKMMLCVELAVLVIAMVPIFIVKGKEIDLLLIYGFSVLSSSGLGILWAYNSTK